jgi:3-oxoacyl-[acyl-carrier-protein] synthase-3
LKAHGENTVMIVQASGSVLPATHETVEKGQHFISLDGRAVFRFAVQTMRDLIERAVADHGYVLDDIGLIVPHQVNKRILDAAVAKLDIEPERVYININRYGNTSGASVPVALAEAHASGKIPEGKLVVLCAFGAGLTWGYALLRW